MIYSPPVRVTSPQKWPASVATAKVQWSVDREDHDKFIETLLQAATLKVENEINRALITQTWRQDFSTFKEDILLGRGDVIDITSVHYFDAANVQQAVDPTHYGFVTGALGSTLSLAGGQSWPSPYGRSDAIRVTWTAGFGPNASDVPPDLQYAVLMLGQYWYDAGAMGGEEIPAPVRRILAPYARIFI